MKDKELYRLIDNLKPDSCLKNRICNAVESKDIIRSERKPVFIPVVMMLLICVNLGAMTLFFTGEMLNSKWSESGVSSFEQDSTIDKSGITMQDQIESFLKEISQNEYDWFDVQNYHVNLPYNTAPWYSMGIYDLDLRFNTDYEYSEDPEDTIRYRKYVQKVPVEFTGYYGSAVYTNHEYLVCYDGKGKEYENIVYVIESSFDLTKGDYFNGKSYKELLEVMGKEPERVWDDEERLSFKTTYDRFAKAFTAAGGDKLDLTCSDAFLIYVKISGYTEVEDKTEK